MVFILIWQCFQQLIHRARCSYIQPNNGIVQWFARTLVPYYGCFPLICNANGNDILQIGENRKYEIIRISATKLNVGNGVHEIINCNQRTFGLPPSAISFSIVFSIHNSTVSRISVALCSTQPSCGVIFRISTW